MLRQIRRSTYALLFVVALVAAGCVHDEWEVTLGADGQIDQWVRRTITEDADYAEFMFGRIEADRPAIERLHPYVQVTTRSEDGTYTAEMMADFAGAREAGIDLLAEMNRIASLAGHFDILVDHGMDESGRVYIEYFFEGVEEDSDDVSGVARLDSPTAQIVTQMPGAIVDFTEGELLNRQTHSLEFGYVANEEGLHVRVEADPARKADRVERVPSMRPIEPSMVEYEIIPVRPEHVTFENLRVEAGTLRQESPITLGQIVYRSDARGVSVIGQGALRLRERVIPPGGTLPFFAGTVYPVRNFVTPQAYVHSFSFQEGLLGTEVIGQFTHGGPRDYSMVALGLSFFNAQGLLIDHHTVLIHHAPVGRSQGFKVPLYGFDSEDVVMLRWEWKFAF